MKEGQPPEHFQLPEDIRAWLTEKLEADIGNAFDSTVQAVLLEAYTNSPGKWLQATEVLRKFKCLKRVQVGIKVIAEQQELKKNLAARQRRKVQTADDMGVDFKILRVVKVGLQDPMYHMEIEDVSGKIELRNLSARVLMSPRLFQEKYMGQANRIPGMPPTAPMWHAIVTNALQNAREDVDTTDEATPEGMATSIVLDCLNGWGIGEDLGDLKRHRLYRDDEDFYYVSFQTLAEVLDTAKQRVSPQLLGSILRDLGCEPTMLQVGRKRKRTWRFKRPLGDDDDDSKPVATLIPLPLPDSER